MGFWKKRKGYAGEKLLEKCNFNIGVHVFSLMKEGDHESDRSI
jgi:hypothetical protein